MAMPPRYPGNPTRLLFLEVALYLLVMVGIGLVAATWL